MPQKVIFVISEHGRVIEERIVTSPYKTVFHNMKKGEYTLDAHGLDAEGKIMKDEKFHDTVTNVGIGDIIIAIGDSTTEGHFLYKTQIPNWLSAPSEYLSSDRRTYPQPGGKATFPTQTWLPELSTYLTEMYGYPVFIKNAGYSEITTGKYLTLMRTKEWQERQHALQPNKWLIQLGVNDGLFNIAPKKYKDNLQTIITILKTDYDAQSKNIFLAKPTYTVGIDRTEKLLPMIDELWVQESVARGPNLWEYFSTKHGPPYSYYKDQFHPNEKGIKEEVKLWYKSFVDQEGIAIALPFYTRYYIQNIADSIQRKVKAKVEKVQSVLHL